MRHLKVYMHYIVGISEAYNHSAQLAATRLGRSASLRAPGAGRYMLCLVSVSINDASPNKNKVH